MKNTPLTVQISMGRARTSRKDVPKKCCRIRQVWGLQQGTVTCSESWPILRERRADENRLHGYQLWTATEKDSVLLLEFKFCLRKRGGRVYSTWIKSNFLSMAQSLVEKSGTVVPSHNLRIWIKDCPNFLHMAKHESSYLNKHLAWLKGSWHFESLNLRLAILSFL